MRYWRHYGQHGKPVATYIPSRGIGTRQALLRRPAGIACLGVRLYRWTVCCRHLGHYPERRRWLVPWERLHGRPNWRRRCVHYPIWLLDFTSIRQPYNDGLYRGHVGLERQRHYGKPPHYCSCVPLITYRICLYRRARRCKIPRSLLVCLQVRLLSLGMHLYVPRRRGKEACCPGCQWLSEARAR